MNVDPNESAVASPSGREFEYRFQASSTHAQRAAILHFQKSGNIRNRVSLTSSALAVVLPWLKRQAKKTETVVDDEILRCCRCGWLRWQKSSEGG